MKVMESVISLEIPYETLPEGTALFDIETTGLSADTSYLYLIGAIYRRGTDIVCRQWFCDYYSDEKEVLASFKEFLSDKTTLIHYNGTGFDIPFLNKKWKRHCLFMSLDASQTIDYYKLFLPYKRLFCAPDFRQKTIEQAAGFYRTDTFDGGDLIDVYAAYTGKYRLAELTGKSEEADALRAVLLLHNHDDLLGLLQIHAKSNLADILSGHCPLSIERSNQLLIFEWTAPAFPIPLSHAFSFGTLSVSETTTTLAISLCFGELKYFFSNYKEYSYLPLEDSAIHNSVAEFVDKSAKVKCTPATAFQKKTGAFLPLPKQSKSKSMEIPGAALFFTEYKSEPAYIEYSDELFTNSEFTFAYVSALLTALAKNFI